MPHTPTIAVFNSLIGKPFYGGAEASVERIVADLIESGFFVETYSIRKPGHPKRRTANMRVDYGLRNFNIYFKWADRDHGRLSKLIWNAVDSLPSFSAITCIMRMLRKRPIAIISNNLQGLGYTPWIVSRVLKIPLVHIARDYNIACIVSSTLRAGKQCQTLCSPCRVRYTASKFLWPSGAQLAVLSEKQREHFSSLDALLSPHCVITHPIVEIGGTGGGAAETAKMEHQVPVVGYIGRVSPEKGIEDLLSIANELTMPVLVAGTGSREYVSSIKHRFPDAQFIGQVSFEEFSSKISLLVVPSKWVEPFGRVAAEAALARVPVLVRANGGLVEAAASYSGSYATFDSQEELRLRLQQFSEGTLPLTQSDGSEFPSMSVNALIEAVTRKKVDTLP